jgi:hypothetical protein
MWALIGGCRVRYLYSNLIPSQGGGAVFVPCCGDLSAGMTQAPDRVLAVMGNANDWLSLRYQPDKKRDVTDPRLHAEDERDLVGATIDHLAVMDGNILAAVGLQQLREEAQEGPVLALPLRQPGSG